ncbi:MAG: glycosyltransferase [Bacteroidales bacterium]|jgi:glycosyltransferase involved in cell wall biosynthesis|nr:glycosyltransferase [Bacteroidales bacterium]
MDILILTHSYPDEKNKWRGTFIKDQAKALSEIHDVTVVYFTVDNNRLAPFTNFSFSKNITGNLTEYSVTVPRSFPVINQVKYLFVTYKFISDHILNKKKIDIIHSHLSYPAGFLGTIIYKIKRIPNVITEHTWIRKYFRSPIHKICVKYALNNCSLIIAVSNALKTDIQNFSTNSISVVPNVVDIERFPLAERKRDENINLGLLGGLSNYRKGLDLLIKAASKLSIINFIIHIGGTGSLLDSYKRMAKEYQVDEKCKFYGEIQPEKVPDYFSNLDIFVLASRDETFGMVVIEAMSVGLPVIATKCGGPQEIVTPSSGLLVSPENVDELVDAIEQMSVKLETYDRIAIRKYTSDTYGYNAFRNSISKIYNDVFESVRARR